MAFLIGVTIGVIIVGVIILMAVVNMLKKVDSTGIGKRITSSDSFKRRSFDIIIALASESPEITNDGVAKALKIDTATAMQYLGELEQKGQIVQSGRSGNSVIYRKAS